MLLMQPVSAWYNRWGQVSRRSSAFGIAKDFCRPYSFSSGTKAVRKTFYW